MEYYSAIRKDEYLTFTLTWTELEGIMLSKISQSEKDNYTVSLMCGTYETVQSIIGKGRENRMGVIREGEKP